MSYKSYLLCSSIFFITHIFGTDYAYVVDAGNHRVRVINTETEAIDRLVVSSPCMMGRLVS